MFITKTLTDNIYEKLRADILELRYIPGEKVSENQLAKTYNVSRAPIRDALRKLQQEKLVIVKPQSGTVISPIYLHRALEICAVRLLLEPYAAEVATPKISCQELKLLGDQINTLRANKVLNKEENATAIFETDRKLHRTILSSCENREIENILNNYSDEINRVRLSTIKLADRSEPVKKEIEEIYRALKKRDSAAARDRMYRHILNFKKSLEFVLTKEGKVI